MLSTTITVLSNFLAANLSDTYDKYKQAKKLCAKDSDTDTIGSNLEALFSFKINFWEVSDPEILAPFEFKNTPQIIFII